MISFLQIFLYCVGIAVFCHVVKRLCLRTVCKGAKKGRADK